MPTLESSSHAVTATQSRGPKVLRAAASNWPVAAWLVVCVFLNVVGWTLSALSELNVFGYLISLSLGLGALAWGINSGRIPCPQFRFRSRRFRRFLPGAFATLTLLAMLGGLLHASNNYDALAYRLPRILHWLAEGRWHWIDTGFHRLNTRSCGFEWVAAPIIALTHSDRLLFLIEFISYLLLPGLFFSILTRLGVNRRAAWCWMWVLPSGYCYLLQAGSLANDIMGGTFALIAIDYALRARRTRRISDLWLAILGLALLTGSKTSNLPLALPWLVAVWPALPLLWDRPVASIAVAAAAALASFLPVGALNFKYCGDWTGWAAERCVMGQGDYAYRVSHNVVDLTLKNLAPPIFPFAKKWNAFMQNRFTPAEQAHLLQSFESIEAFYWLPEMQTEEESGLGFGVTLLLLGSCAAALYRKRVRNRLDSPIPRRIPLWTKVLLLCCGISFLPFLMKTGWGTISRLSNPYYGLLIPLFLLSREHGAIVRSRWWRAAAGAVFLIAALLVILSPSRPLWPARTVLAKMSADHKDSRFWARAKRVFDVYGARWDALAPLRDRLPPDAGRVVGMVTWDDPETSLWRPFGSRRILHVLPGDSLAQLQAAGIHYALVSSDHFEQLFNEPVERWLHRIQSRVIATISIELRAGEADSTWYVVRVGEPSIDNPKP